MTIEEELLSTTNAFFNALAANTHPLRLLSFFSSTIPVIIQHAPVCCPHPQSSRMVGLNAVRSYFDILATHWTRSGMEIHNPPRIDPNSRRVVTSASVTWMWRGSGRRWTEDFTCTLEFDESLKIVSFIIRTDSAPGTCVMKAKDIEPPPSNGSSSRTAAPVPVSIPFSFRHRESFLTSPAPYRASPF